jgi:glyoxylase-like metal-dependent hydrolase (beta-lactamase superfamily II)
MPQPHIQHFFDPATHSFSYVVWDPATLRAAVIDPVLDYDAAAGRTRHDGADVLVAFVRGQSLQVDWIIETHVHADHLSAAPYVQAQLGGRIGIGERVCDVQSAFGDLFHAGAGFARDGSQFDHLFADGETWRLGDIDAQVLHTPGHTPACVTQVIGDAAFVGDTLFMPDYGTARCDFPGGDARTLYRSIQRIFALPPTTRVFLCHDYLAPGREAFANQTTVAAQRRDNIHVRDGIDEDSFVRMREARDATLSVPALLLPAVQVNMRAGHPPPPETNGVSYLKIPLDTL